ncbi:DUF6646 family protein [Kaistella montana]|uniref:DUF6646 family protein n=1 Tax=Kaistella montana TaxID=1849733 RepID=A0ABW5K9K5_9FLAO|nr:DUF6646 family protein [Kaistella montana]MCQ4035696.1 hypothetical protein [Kaistella montana]
MKKLLLVCSMFFLGQMAFAQAWNGKGDQKLQVGFNGWGYGTGITATYDYGLGNIVSLGAGANFFFDHNNDKYADDDFGVFGRVNFHLQEPLSLPEQWDIYPGVDLGLLGKSGTYFGAHLGVRYFFNNNVGIYGEFGNNGSLGVSFNF